MFVATSNFLSALIFARKIAEYPAAYLAPGAAVKLI
jgi:hypothetical protein